MENLPAWLQSLKKQWRTGEIHSFLLYNNVWDDVLRDGLFERIYDVLRKEEPISQAAIVVYFNICTGVRFADDDSKNPLMKKLFIELLLSESKDPVFYFEDNKRRLLVVLDWFYELLRIGWDSGKLKEGKKQEFLDAMGKLPEDSFDQKKAPFAVIVLEYDETIAPSDASSSSCNSDRQAVVNFQWWAQDTRIRETRNIIIHITEALNSVAPELRDQTRGFWPIKIDFPDSNQLEDAVGILREKYPAKEGDIPDKHLAQLMKGLPLVGAKRILADAHLAEELLSANLVFERKAKIIAERTGGLLRIKRSPWTFDTLGGLNYVVNYIQQVVRAIKKGDFMAVPSGVLFIGAPGTGKTVCAEVIAHEADIPFAEFGSTRDPFVGMSERNMELSLEILRANAPVIVFQDEIDTFFLRRGEVYHGDSGVNARLTGMLMEFLSDSTIRGRVLWIGATNRPDLLDAAILRAGRFDDKIPFLIPTAKERPDIIRALLRKQEIRAQQFGQSFEWELSDEDVRKISEMFDFWIDDGKISPGPPPSKGAALSRIPLTGAEIEDIIQRADRLLRVKDEKVLRMCHLVEKIKDSLPTRNIFEYSKMDDMALLHANDLNFIPESQRERARKLRVEMGDSARYSVLPRSG